MTERTRTDKRCSARKPGGTPCANKSVFAYGWGGAGIDLCPSHSAVYERYLRETEQGVYRGKRESWA